MTRKQQAALGAVKGVIHDFTIHPFRTLLLLTVVFVIYPALALFFVPSLYFAWRDHYRYLRAISRAEKEYRDSMRALR